MQYENHEKHHTKKDLGWVAVEDKYGQVHVVAGQGVRQASIYGHIHVAQNIRKVWLERPDGSIAYQPRGKQSDTVAALTRLRDWSYPHCTVVEWVGDDEDNGHYTHVNRPKSVTVTSSAPKCVTVTVSKAKQKKKSSKIRWP
jgi:hypothetical protein